MKRKDLFWRAVFVVLVFHVLVSLFGAFAGTSGRIRISKGTKLMARKLEREIRVPQPSQGCPNDKRPRPLPGTPLCKLATPLCSQTLFSQRLLPVYA